MGWISYLALAAGACFLLRAAWVYVRWMQTQSWARTQGTITGLSVRHTKTTDVNDTEDPKAPGDAMLHAEAEWTRVALHLVVGAALVGGTLYVARL